MDDVSHFPVDENVALTQLLLLIEGETCTSPTIQASDRAAFRAVRVDKILSDAHVDAATRICALLEICPGLSKTNSSEQIVKRYGEDVAGLVTNMGRVGSLHRRIPRETESRSGAQLQLSLELLRRMLLAMAQDIRVVIVFLSIRLDQLRQYAEGSEPTDLALCLETRDVLVPLANRLGLGFLKWELEDLAFRFLEPLDYKSLAKALDEKRVVREQFIDESVAKLRDALTTRKVPASVYGRPKHLTSIAQKLKLKRLSMGEIHDLRALRVIVGNVQDCYLALDVVNSLWRSRSEEFDDYIAKPKANGYQSIHCVMIAEDGRSLEVQIRTEEMHRFAEYGVASHWRYKERGGTPPAKGSSASSQSSHEAQLNWMRQLLAWQQDLAKTLEAQRPERPAMPEKAQDRVYVLTPQARIIELPAGATPLDFAYHLHSGLGHRCRGAKVNGVLVPLYRPLSNADTVEILLASKNQFDAGPSLDWLGQDPVYLVSARSKTKVRQWFAAQQLEAAGLGPTLEQVQRSEGKPEAKGDQRNKASIDSRVTGPQEIEIKARAQATDSGILVVGVDALMTRLARCCRPIPPDEITGYVSMGKGVTVHRTQCSSLTRLVGEKTERLIATSWGDWEKYRAERRYPVDIELMARDRALLLRDVSEVFAKGKWNVSAAKTLSRKDNASMRFTIEVASLPALREAISHLAQVSGVESVRRRADLGRKALHTDS